MSKNKRLGSSYECLFLFECLKRGLHPHEAVGDYLGHDTVVMNDAGRFYKVNVKGTSSPRCSNGGAKRYLVSVGTGQDKKPLDCTKVDIVAVFIEPLNDWYLVPCLAVSNLSTLKFYPNTPNGSKAITEKFRNDWSCFFQ